MVRMQTGEQKRARKELDLLGHEESMSDALSSGEMRRMSLARKLIATGCHAAKCGEWDESAALYDEASQHVAAACASHHRWTDWATEGHDDPACGNEICTATDRMTSHVGQVNVGPQLELSRPTGGCASIAKERLRTLSGRASFGAGLAHAFLGDFDKATAHFDQAARSRRDCGFTMYNRAVLHLAAARWDLAELDLKACVERLPLMPDGWLKKYDAIIAQGDKGRKGHALCDYANALVAMDFDPRTKFKPEG
jgi:tetratricopeptide (TPR) repeat protein